MTERKEACHKHRSRKLSKLILKNGMGIFLSIITASLGGILAFYYTERPVVYFSIKPPKVFSDQNSFCLIIHVWNTGGMNAWVDIIITIKSFSSLPSTPFLQKHYLALVRISALLIGRSSNYTIIPVCIDLQRISDRHDVTVDVTIRFTLCTIFGEQHTLSPTSFTYRRQGSNKYLPSG